jgi:hypothetical protein
VPVRKCFLAAIHICALFLLLTTARAQQDPATAEEVVSRYMQAIGAEKFSTITTFVQRGDLDGNLSNFWQGYRSPMQSQGKEHGTFESYFKSPNLRFSSTVSDKNMVIGLHGCDGTTAWYIDSFLRHTEFKLKPGSEYDCWEGFQLVPSHLREPKVKMRLLKKKEIEGHTAWEIKVDAPKSSVTETYYFDAETFLLLRSEVAGSSVTYSDYRDLQGIKLAFTTIRSFSNSKLVITLREVKINGPIDDARFAEPQVKGRSIQINPAASPEANPVTSHTKENTGVPTVVSPTTPATNSADATAASTSKSDTVPPAASIVEVNFPNFTSCTIAELRLIAPELKGLKPAADQEKLATLLEKVGAKTLDISHNTPNLISRETVIESPQGAAETRRDYDYLILAHLEGKIVGLDEFRVDLKSGEKFQTEDVLKSESSARADLERASQQLAASQTGRPPTSQGFANSWVYFAPGNRGTATFRYLGEQKMDGQRTLVLAFAQKPPLVISPAIFRYQGKLVPMYLQGMAWVDPSDFRILRLRTDLLSPLPEVALHRLTADITFALTRIEQMPSPLVLPREVTVTTTVAESTSREIHKYSDYRLFRVKSRIVPVQ